MPKSVSVLIPPSRAEADRYPYRHPLVRDLAWSLRSPALLAPPPGVAGADDADLQAAVADYEGRLHQLDAEPSALVAHMQAQRSTRLGDYFEALVAFWLADVANTHFRLLARGLTIQVGRRTRGELDFIVCSIRAGVVEHWEVAVKFHLGLLTPFIGWLGPAGHDRLEAKYQRLCQHQLPMAFTAETTKALQLRGLRVERQRLFAKGRVFYPLTTASEGLPLALLAPDHLRGWWCHHDDFLDHWDSHGLVWSRLVREQWLCPVDTQLSGLATCSAQTLIAALRSTADNRALGVIGFGAAHEVTRGFVAPPQWPQCAP